MDKKTTGIIAAGAAVLLCVCPGLFSLCLGAFFALVGSIPGTNIDVFGSNDPQMAISLGIAGICLGVPSILFGAYIVIVVYQKQTRRLHKDADNDPTKSHRTIIEFSRLESIWPIVDIWSMDQKFNLQEKGDFARLYNRYGDPTIREMVKISQIDDLVRIEAWVKDIVGEHDINPGAIYGIFPRKNARGGVNVLLRGLGQPIIQ